MSGLHGLWLVAGRELREALRGRAFWISFGLVLLASTAGMVVPEVIGDDGPTTYDVGLVAPAAGLADGLRELGRLVDAEVRIEELDDEAAAEAAVLDDVVDAAVVDGGDATVIVRSGEHDELVALLQQGLYTVALTARLEAAGLPADEVAGALAVPAPELQELDAAREDRRGAAAITAIVLYLLLFMLMMQVANGTGIEKANRISEVLLAIVRPGALLFGKVVGVGITGMLTLTAAFGPVVVKFALGGDLPDGIGGALAAAAAWLVLGLALYLVAAGALGALVERQEEASSAVSPLMIVLIGAYLVGQSASDTPLGGVLAVVPLTSPLVMPSRIAVGAATPVEIVASLVLGVAAVVVMARVGSVVYRRAIVRTGARLKLTDVLRG